MFKIMKIIFLDLFCVTKTKSSINIIPVSKFENKK